MATCCPSRAVAIAFQVQRISLELTRAYLNSKPRRTTSLNHLEPLEATASQQPFHTWDHLSLRQCGCVLSALHHTHLSIESFSKWWLQIPAKSVSELLGLSKWYCPWLTLKTKGWIIIEPSGFCVGIRLVSAFLALDRLFQSANAILHAILDSMANTTTLEMQIEIEWMMSLDPIATIIEKNWKKNSRFQNSSSAGKQLQRQWLQWFQCSHKMPRAPGPGSVWFSGKASEAKPAANRSTDEARNWRAWGRPNSVTNLMYMFGFSCVKENWKATWKHVKHGSSCYLKNCSFSLLHFSVHVAFSWLSSGASWLKVSYLCSRLFGTSQRQACRARSLKTDAPAALWERRTSHLGRKSSPSERHLVIWLYLAHPQFYADTLIHMTCSNIM